MPELPEVETIKRGLDKLLRGKVIGKVSYDWPKSFNGSKQEIDKYLIGATVKSIKRRAKLLLIELSTGYTLAIHLKMTGQLVFVGNANQTTGLTDMLGDANLRNNASDFAGEQSFGASTSNGVNRTDGTKKRVAQVANQKFASSQANQATGLTDMLGDANRWGAGHPNDSLIGNLPDKSTRVIFTFKDASKMYFNDQRKFGWVKLLPTSKVKDLDFIKKLGPEPLNNQFTLSEFINRISKRKNSSIKATILDQSVLAGVGNIYADESLFVAKIHPSTKVGNLKKAQFAKLHSAIKQVLQEGIDSGGSSDKNYVNAEGKKGSYLTFAKVFRRQGQDCFSCKNKIIKIKVAGRGTHVCLNCQKLPKGSK